MAPGYYLNIVRFAVTKSSNHEHSPKYITEVLCENHLNLLCTCHPESGQWVSGKLYNLALLGIWMQTAGGSVRSWAVSLAHQTFVYCLSYAWGFQIQLLDQGIFQCNGTKKAPVLLWYFNAVEQTVVARYVLLAITHTLHCSLLAAAQSCSMAEVIFFVLLDECEYMLSMSVALSAAS